MLRLYELVSGFKSETKALLWAQSLVDKNKISIKDHKLLIAHIEAINSPMYRY